MAILLESEQRLKSEIPIDIETKFFCNSYFLEI